MSLLSFLGLDGKARSVSNAEPLPVDIGQNVSVTIGAEVEVKNDIGSPVPVRVGGAIGISYANAQPAVNTLGTLLATIPANSNRVSVFIQNQSASDLTLVMDDGSENQFGTRILTGVGQGLQGAEFVTDRRDGPFTGRLRVYGASNTRFSAREI